MVIFIKLVVVVQLCESLGGPTSDLLRQELRQLTCDPGEEPAPANVLKWWSRVGGRYLEIGRVLPYLFSLPNSNAATERCFSILKAVHTPTRNSLHIDTINSLLHIKINKASNTYEVDDKDTILLKCKKATKDYNLAHSNN